MFQEVEVAFGGGFAVELADAVAEQAAVQADEALFGQFADERGDVLVLDVGVGVVLRARGRVDGVAVVEQELQLVAHLAVLGVALTIEHERFGHVVVARGHEGHFDLILDVLDTHAVAEGQPAVDGVEFSGFGDAAHGDEGLEDGTFDFVGSKGGAAAVALGDGQVVGKHGCDDG